jgi:hypothetical protein
MHRLPVLDGAGMDAEAVEKALRSRITDANAEGKLAGAVIGQIVRNTPREVWSLVDVAALRLAASGALHYEVGVEPVRRSEASDEDTPRPVRAVSGLSEIRTVLASVAAQELTGHPEELCRAVVSLADELLEAEMSVITGEEEVPS